MEKIYGGNAKMITTQFGDIWKVSQNRSDLEKLLKYMNDNDTEWVNLDIKEKPNKVEGKPTHYLELYQPKAKNDFRPAKEKNDWTPVVSEKKIIDKYENDTLPF
jgi:hypothetical protein